MDAEHLKFPTDQFDVALSGFAIHTMPHPGTALREIYRVLKPGGVAAVSLPGPTAGSRWQFYADLIAEYAPHASGRPLPQPIEEPIEMMQEAGFVHIETQNVEVHVPIESPEAFHRAPRATAGRPTPPPARSSRRLGGHEALGG